MLTKRVAVEVLTRLGRALTDESRARILMSLLDEPGYPADLARELELTRSNVSNHLACLRGCGFVVAEPEGRRTRYEIADPHLTLALREALRTVVAVDAGSPCDDEGCRLGCCAPLTAEIARGAR